LNSRTERVIVVKIGGSTLGEHDTTLEDVVELQKQGRSLIIVHGGGKLITEWLTRHGISSRFVQGRRVTDSDSLEVVVSVLAGLVNKEIVAEINNLGGRAVGLCGADGQFIQGKIRDADLGYVGEVENIDFSVVDTLLDSGYIPVVAPIGLYSPESKDEKVLLLNINADTVAGEIAAAIKAERLIFLTDVEGIRDGDGKLSSHLSADEAEALVASGVASGGMIPKVEACLRALPNMMSAHIIDGRQPHALFKEIKDGGSGTIIKNR